MENNKTELTDQLASLKKAYLNKIKDVSLVLKSLKEYYNNIEEIYSHVHKLSGTSGMYGFTQISELSTEFEIFIKNNKDKEEAEIKDALTVKFELYLENLVKLIDMEGEKYA